ncbi:hypothetical protein CsatA_021610 [Cannabis sativa]
MDHQYAAMSLGEDDEGFLMYEDVSVDTVDFDDRWCLVGRFLTDRSIDFDAMQHKMASLWRPVRGLFVKELEPNLFLFQFYHDMDIDRVVEGSPWTFDRIPLIFERLKQGENPRCITPVELTYWVQIHGLIAGFRSETVLKDLGNYIGSYVKMDQNNFAGGWRDYLRIRVRIRVDAPLKKGRKLQMRNGPECKAMFKYEDLTTFCFVCGLLGHSERFCEKAFDTPPHLLVKPYDLEMKAAPRRRSHTIGAKWLRPEMAGKQIGETSATPATSRSEVRIIPAQAGAEIMGGNRGVIDGDADILVHNFDLNGGGNKGDIIGKSAMGNNEEADMENQIVLEQKRRRVSMGINGELPQENMTMEHDMFDVCGNEHVMGDVNISSMQKNLSGAGSGLEARQEL